MGAIGPRGNGGAGNFCRETESESFLKRLVSVLVLALLVALAGAAVATAKPKPKMTVTKLSNPPATAKAGDTFAVKGTVANKGKKKGKVRVKVTLRKSKNGPVAAKLFQTKKLKIKAKKKKNFSGQAAMPAGAGAPNSSYNEYLEAGSYVVVACVKKRGNSGPEKCKASSAVTVEAQTTPPPPPPPPPTPNFTPGARSAGDSLFPQIGNGGYDAEHYDIDLNYDPTTNTFGAGTATTMSAVATQDLSEFSLDFQQLNVSEVLVDGVAADFTQEESEPELTSSFVPDPTQPSKLTVTPEEGIVDGADFEVEIRYTGEPEVWVDVDQALEGWVPACYTVSSVETCEGNYVVGEPLGSQAWFPSNNIQTDKAAFDTSVTLPSNQTAFGVGELVGDAAVDNGNGTSTWSWTEDDEIPTYLVTASNGNMVYSEDSMVLGGRTLPIYNAIDASGTPTQLATAEANLRRGKNMLRFLEDAYGTYPFDSSGAWVERSGNIGYALEVATKSHYSGGNSGPSLSVGTELHELSHQWFGNNATNEDWADLWFNEGWAQWSTWYWSYEDNGSSTSPAQQFTANYTPGTKWETPPATLLGDPELLFFPSFPTYTRGAMTLEGFRQIIGNTQFLAFAKGLQEDFAYDNISTEEFVDYALEFSGFAGADLALLEDYFEEWLYGNVQPTILPADFS